MAGSEDATVETVDRWAAVLIFLTAFTGVLANVFIGIYIHRLPMLRNSFGRLLQLQAFGDGIFVSVWAFYFAPVLFLFISLYLPTHYSVIFTDRFTNGLVITIVVVSFTFSWFLVAVDCLMGFSIPRWMLDYQLDRCNLVYVHYAEFWRGLILIGIFALVNLMTFTRMHFHNNRKKGTSAFETVQQVKRRQVERTFIQQVTVQGLIYALELLTYFYVSVYFPVDDKTIATDANRWPNFLLTTYAWILVHTLDGLVTLAFNRQFRRVITSPFRSKNSENGNGHSHVPASGHSHV